jgi:spore coat polysaccharide biosynthesis protein SpsF
MTPPKKLDLILQARLGSSRLPRKILLPFYEGQSILEIILQRLQSVNYRGRIVVATTTAPQDDEIEAMCNNMHVACFRGSEHDVLQRYVDSMTHLGSESCIRICADNPFLEANLIDQLIIEAQPVSPSPLDYASFRIHETPAIRTHYGIFTEFISKQALIRAIDCGASAFDREHVTKFVYEHPHLFSLHWINATSLMQHWDNVRLTVDTPRDFAIAQQLYAYLMHQGGNISHESLTQAIQTHPQWRNQMRQEIEANGK